MKKKVSFGHCSNYLSTSLLILDDLFLSSCPNLMAPIHRPNHSAWTCESHPKFNILFQIWMELVLPSLGFALHRWQRQSLSSARYLSHLCTSRHMPRREVYCLCNTCWKGALVCHWLWHWGDDRKSWNYQPKVAWSSNSKYGCPRFGWASNFKHSNVFWRHLAWPLWWTCYWWSTHNHIRSKGKFFMLIDNLPSDRRSNAWQICHCPAQCKN